MRAGEIKSVITQLPLVEKGVVAGKRLSERMVTINRRIVVAVMFRFESQVRCLALNFDLQQK